MTKHEARRATMGRRAALQGMGAGMVLLGCGDDGEAMGDGSGSGSSGGPGGSSGSSSDGGGGSSSGVADATGSSGSSSGSGSGSSSEGIDDSSSTGTPIDCEPASEWASGGTAAMTAQDCYPDPFAAGVASCVLYCSTTAGPCTADTIERQDVSEGLSGLPVRLALKLVAADGCTPVGGAIVEIWHTQRTGVYSGNTPMPMFCSGGDPKAPSQLYMRGSQTTDAEGRVDFDTCYPGWYPGRAIHIHFRVILNDQEFLTSQLFFDDALNQELFASHPEYTKFGQPNTTNESDNIIGDTVDKSPYLLDTARMPDGAMLASKVIAIRSSTAEPLCST
jgi:protocatechuate 3,4-dioxygenase beta subunit